MITITRVQDLKKNGELKRGKSHEVIFEEYDDYDKLAKEIKEKGYRNFSSPYFFTHLKAINKHDEEVVIFQTYYGMTTSPLKLEEALK
jgi:hypothetical protein